MKKIFLLLLIMVLMLTLASCTFDMTQVSGLLSQYNINLPFLQTHTCVDANGDTYCDVCSGYVAPTACVSHIDNNNDGFCDNPGCTGTVLMQMVDVVFNSRTYTYDGKPKTLKVNGAPEGAEIDYDIENTHTDAGTYEITATITAHGYEPFEITATLKIKQRTISLTWGEDEGLYASSGRIPDIEYSLEGVLPGETVEVKLNFGDCDFTEEGEFQLVATSKNPNYKINTAGGANKLDFVVGPNSHQVVFITNIDGKTLPDKSVEDGETVDKPSISVLGYEFVGWYNGEELWDFDTPITKGITLTAKWNLNKYKITYHLNGGTNAPGNPTSYTVEDGIRLSVPEKDGKIFLGWYEDSTYQTPLNKTAPGERVNDIALFAKWSGVEYNEIVNEDDLDAEFVLDKYLAAGTFRYTFSANVSDLGDNGVIYIGRGKDTADGSYFKITNKTISVLTNADTQQTESKAHSRPVRDFIVVDIIAKKNGANVYMRTASGELSAYFASFVGKNGEIFVSSENAELSDVNLGWSTEAYDSSVWILADSGADYNDKTSWTYKLANGGYIDALLMSAKNADSTEVLTAFKDALLLSTPKYALWSFDSESGATYDANLASFITICKEKGITPVLTTQLEAVSASNKQKNKSVIASGERYVDFASLERYSGLYSGGYTELAAAAFYAKLLVDFPEIITPNSLVDSAEAEILNSENKTLVVAENKTKDGKVTVFTAKINGEFGADAKIIIGHGYGSTYSAWTEINATKTISYSQGAKADAEPGKSATTHGLTIKNYITLIMIEDKNLGFVLTIVTDGGTYTRSLRGSSCNGKIAVTIEGVELTDAKMHFACTDYESPIWVFGASYFSLGDPARWPYYLYQDKLNDEILIVGRGGLNTTGGLVELKDALRHGSVPKYIIWGYGMNDGADSESDIKAVTYKNHIEFLEICKEYGIEAIFLSSVNCTTNFHTHKIDYVANRLGEFANYDYRVASLPHAVDGYEEGSEWYDGMLSSDGIHPTALGARNFYLEVVCQFPELLMGGDSVVKSASAQTLSKGATLKVSGTPEFLDGDFAFSMTADFDSRFTGAIEIGNGKGVEGGTWVRITEDKVEVYRTVAGQNVLVAEEENEISLEEIFMIRIIVKDNKASIAFVSSAENSYDSSNDRKALFSVTADWSFAGEVFASADSMTLTDVLLNFVTK